MNMAAAQSTLDRELSDLPSEQRKRIWMGRIEALLFASDTVVDRAALMRVIGQRASLEDLIDEIRAELTNRPYELAEVAGGWMLRTRAEFADVFAEIERPLTFSELEMAVLCAIAYHQPLDRARLADIFGKEISRDLIARLRHQKLIATGPRSPRPGAPHTFVTTPVFLATFDLHSLRDLPDLGQDLGDADV